MTLNNILRIEGEDNRYQYWVGYTWEAAGVRMNGVVAEAEGPFLVAQVIELWTLKLQRWHGMSARIVSVTTLGNPHPEHQRLET